MKIDWREYIIIRCMVWLWHTFSWLCTRRRRRFTFLFIVHSRLCRIAFNKPRLSKNKNVQRLIAYTVIIRFLCQLMNTGVANYIYTVTRRSRKIATNKINKEILAEIVRNSNFIYIYTFSRLPKTITWRLITSYTLSKAKTYRREDGIPKYM